MMMAANTRQALKTRVDPAILELARIIARQLAAEYFETYLRMQKSEIGAHGLRHIEHNRIRQ
jgi:hypothetical protein